MGWGWALVLSVALEGSGRPCPLGVSPPSHTPPCQLFLCELPLSLTSSPLGEGEGLQPALAQAPGEFRRRGPRMASPTSTPEDVRPGFGTSLPVLAQWEQDLPNPKALRVFLPFQVSPA